MSLSPLTFSSLSSPPKFFPLSISLCVSNLYNIIVCLFVYLEYWHRISLLVVRFLLWGLLFDCKDTKFTINPIDYDRRDGSFGSWDVVRAISVNEGGWDWNRLGLGSLSWKRSSAPSSTIGLLSPIGDRLTESGFCVFFFVVLRGGIVWRHWARSELDFGASGSGSWMKSALAMSQRIRLAVVVVPRTYHRHRRRRLGRGSIGGRGSSFLVLMRLWTSRKLCALLCENL